MAQIKLRLVCISVSFGFPYTVSISLGFPYIVSISLGFPFMVMLPRHSNVNGILLDAALLWSAMDAALSQGMLLWCHNEMAIIVSRDMFGGRISMPEHHLYSPLWEKIPWPDWCFLWPEWSVMCKELPWNVIIMCRVDESYPGLQHNADPGSGWES